MSSTVLRQASSVLRTSSRRTFATSQVVRKDFVQDLYIKELKAYKAPPAAKDAHVGVVKNFSDPQRPTPPSVPADLASELSKYDAAEPGHQEAAHTTSAGQHHGEDDVGKGAQAYLAFLEADLPKAEVHH